MEHLCFTACLADPDAWMRPVIKSNDQEHYKCVLLHTDDALVASDEPEDIIPNHISKYFVLKKGSIGLPTRHLGSKVLFENVAKDWTFSSSQCVRAATDNVESYLTKK